MQPIGYILWTQAYIVESRENLRCHSSLFQSLLYFPLSLELGFFTRYQSPRALTSNSILPLSHFKKKKKNHPKSSSPQIFLFLKNDHRTKSLTSRSKKPMFSDHHHLPYAPPCMAKGFGFLFTRSRTLNLRSTSSRDRFQKVTPKVERLAVNMIMTTKNGPNGQAKHPYALVDDSTTRSTLLQLVHAPCTSQQMLSQPYSDL